MVQLKVYVLLLLKVLQPERELERRKVLLTVLSMMRLLVQRMELQWVNELQWEALTKELHLGHRTVFLKVSLTKAQQMVPRSAQLSEPVAQQSVPASALS